jgi:thiol-disulfide isomerase/thioredoxin
MARLTLPLVALALLVFPAAALASDAHALLQRVSRALTQDGTVRYDAILSDAPDLRDADLVVRSQVLARFTESGALDAATVDSRLTRKSDSRRGRLALTVAGGEAQLLDYISKREHRAKADELVSGPSEIRAGALPLYLPMFFSSGAGAVATLTADSLTLEGPVRDGRDECNVIRGDFGAGSIALFVTDDDAPRRIDIINGSDSVTIRFNRLRTGVPATDRSFELRPAPRGFTAAVAATKTASRDAGGTSNASATDRPVGLERGDLAPEWTLADNSGEPHSLSDYRGKVVLMDFWATWCPPCRRAMPGLQRLHEELADDGLVVLGINTWERSPDMAPGFMTSNNYTYTLLMGGDSVARTYEVKGIPTFYVVGTEGEIIFKGRGYSHAQERAMERAIREHLGLAVRRSIDELDDVDLDTIER